MKKVAAAFILPSFLFIMKMTCTNSPLDYTNFALSSVVYEGLDILVSDGMSGLMSAKIRRQACFSQTAQMLD